MKNVLKRAVLSMAVFFALGLFWASSALAHPTPPQLPDQCKTAGTTKRYNDGFLTGTSMTRQAWNGVGQDQDRADEVQAAVLAAIDAIGLPTAPSPNALCRFLGFLDGLRFQLAVIEYDVVGVCIEDGAFTGHFAAVAYCKLSLALNGLGMDVDLVRLAVGMCGENFQSACESTLDTETSAFPEVGSTGKICSDYTEDAFAAVYAQVKNNQCAYNPQAP